jgi:hypothetical protein
VKPRNISKHTVASGYKPQQAERPHSTRPKSFDYQPAYFVPTLLVLSIYGRRSRTCEGKERRNDS